MVCIIDDRIDVWNNAPNLIKVKPYQFFKGVGDINAPSERQHETTPDALESDEKNEKEENEVKCKENITDTEVDPGEKPDKIETTPDALESDEKNEKEENEVKCKENITDTEVDPGEKPDKIDALDAGDVNTKDSDDVKEEDMRVEMDVNSPSSKPENTSCESIKANMDNKEMCQDDSDSKSSLESKQSGEESNDDIKGEGIESTRTDDETKQDIKVTSKTETALESNQDNKTMELNPEVINSEKEAKELCNVSEEPDEAENCTFVVESQEGKKEKSENLGNGLENADGQEACNIDDEQTEVKNTSNVKNIKDHTDMSNNNNGSNGKVQEGESNAEKNDVQKAQTAENGRQEQKTSNAEETGKPQPSDSTSDRQYHVDDDDYLVHLEDILRRIHDKFYSTVDQIKELKAKGIKEADSNIARYCSPGTLTPCTKQIIKELQSQVLKGTNIAFTGVIPTNIQPEKSEIWQRTLRLGAKISRHVVCPKDARHPGKVTTHVIAARLGTEKTYRAMKTPGIKLVKPDWLWCCEERWEWVEERLFSVDGIDKYKKEVRNQRTPQGTPQNWKKSIKTEKNTEVTDDKDETNTDVTTRERTCSSSSADLLMASLHPLLSFSSTEMAAMDKEVEELMNSSADESDVIGSISGSSSSGGSSSSSSSSSSTSSASDDEDGNTKLEDSTKKRRMSDSDGDGDDNLSKKRKEELSPNSDESDDYTRRSSPSDDDDDDDGDDDDDMAALLEAELSHD
ncbi:hypothetical protein QZH41_009847 [Actinostola sp. cb2023]|nr:hypothetical protein QZH41_009847 [Actinostola sp. cb2023]